MDVGERFQSDLRHAMQAVLSDSSSRLVLFWVLDRCGLYQRTANDSGVYVAKGKREVGDEIMSLMNAITPSAYWRFVAEMKDMIEADYSEKENDETTKPAI